MCPSPPSAQRNYHIFYQMLTASAAERAPRKLGSPNDFSLLTTSGCTTAEGIDDSKEFKEMVAALTNLGFSEDEQKQLLNATAAVLHLGELKLAKDEKVAHGDDAAKIADFGPLDTAAALLQARATPRPVPTAQEHVPAFFGRRPSRRPLRDPHPSTWTMRRSHQLRRRRTNLFPRHHPRELGVLSLPNPRIHRSSTTHSRAR